MVLLLIFHSSFAEVVSPLHRLYRCFCWIERSISGGIIVADHVWQQCLEHLTGDFLNPEWFVRHDLFCRGTNFPFWSVHMETFFVLAYIIWRGCHVLILVVDLHRRGLPLEV